MMVLEWTAAVKVTDASKCSAVRWDSQPCALVVAASVDSMTMVPRMHSMGLSLHTACMNDMASMAC